MNKDIWEHIIIIILALGLVAMALNNPTSGTNKESSSTLTTSGTSKLSEAPDEAVIFIAIETSNLNAQDSQTQNNAISENVINALIAEGIEEDGIDTTSFRVFPEYNYFREQREFIGYKTTHSLKVTTSQISKVGIYLDAASKAGANRVDNVQFKLSDDKLEVVRAKLMDMAIKKAKLKAEAMADSAGVNLGKLKSISDASITPTPIFAQARDFAVAEAAVAPIQPGEIDVSGTVSVVYEI